MPTTASRTAFVFVQHRVWFMKSQADRNDRDVHSYLVAGADKQALFQRGSRTHRTTALAASIEPPFPAGAYSTVDSTAASGSMAARDSGRGIFRESAAAASASKCRPSVHFLST